MPIYGCRCETATGPSFLYNKNYCKIFKQKGYYSKDREKEIKFDISIEVFLPGQKTYSCLTLIECKNYSKKVPVDDAEEFFAKIQQISPANTKGIIVSTNSFQDGALKFSRSKGIGLLRYFDTSSFDWILPRLPSTSIPQRHKADGAQIIYEALTTESYISQHFNCYCLFEGEYTNSLNDFISTITNTSLNTDTQRRLTEAQNKIVKKQIKVKTITENEIVQVCSSVHNKIGYQQGKVSLVAITKWLEKTHDLKIVTETKLGKNILGKMTFDPLVIYLNETESTNVGRKRFTLAHEIGHFLLGHGAYISVDRFTLADASHEQQKTILNKDILKMEKQANLFASCLLLPEIQLKETFFHELSRLNIPNKGHGHLFLDDQPCNRDFYYQITDRMMAEFEVSRSTIRIRLVRLGLLREQESEKKLKHISYNFEHLRRI